MAIPPLRHVLVTTDLSQASEPALIAAAALARAHSARLTLLHVLNAGSLAGSSPQRSAVQRLKVAWREEVTPRLELLAERLLAGAPHEVAIAEAAAVPEGVCRFAAAHAVDLLVIATNGRTGIRRWVLGSVTEAVLQTAPCEVLVVRSEAQNNPLQTLGRILVPTDFSEGAEAAVERAISLARCSSAEIHLLHSYAIARTETLRSHAQRMLQSQKGRVEAQGVPVRVHLSPEVPVRAILDASAQLQVELIVIGTRGRRELPRLFSRSVVDPVVRMASCAVLTVKTGDVEAKAAGAEADPIEALPTNGALPADARTP